MRRFAYWASMIIIGVSCGMSIVYAIAPSESAAPLSSPMKVTASAEDIAFHIGEIDAGIRDLRQRRKEAAEALESLKSRLAAIDQIMRRLEQRRNSEIERLLLFLNPPEDKTHGKDTRP